MIRQRPPQLFRRARFTLSGLGVSWPTKDEIAIMNKKHDLANKPKETPVETYLGWSISRQEGYWAVGRMRPIPYTSFVARKGDMKYPPHDKDLNELKKKIESIENKGWMSKRTPTEAEEMLRAEIEDEQPDMRKPPWPPSNGEVKTAVVTSTPWEKIRSSGPYVIYGRWYSTAGGKTGDYNQFVAIKENQTPPKGAAKGYVDRFAASQEEAISKAEEMGDPTPEQEAEVEAETEVEEKEGLTTGAKIGLGVGAAAAAYFLFMR